MTFLNLENWLKLHLNKYRGNILSNYLLVWQIFYNSLADEALMDMCIETLDVLNNVNQLLSKDVFFYLIFINT